MVNKQQKQGKDGNPAGNLKFDKKKFMIFVRLHLHRNRVKHI